MTRWREEFQSILATVGKRDAGRVPLLAWQTAVILVLAISAGGVLFYVLVLR